jgi:hypothetical protein
MRPPKGASSSTDYRCSRYTLYVVVIVANRPGIGAISVRLVEAIAEIVGVALVIAAVVAMLVKAVTK